MSIAEDSCNRTSFFYTWECNYSTKGV